MRRSLLVTAAAVLAVLSTGCVPRGLSGDANRPQVSVEATASTIATAPASSVVTAAASADWLTRDTYLWMANEAMFAQAATEAAAASDSDLAFSFGTLSAPLGRLSSNGGAWCMRSDDRTDVYFNTGTTNYPCADGVIYSSSAKRAPDGTVTKPVQIAPHWWVAAWDPLLFDSFGYGPKADQDFKWDMEIATDTRHMRGVTHTISGRIVAEVDIASLGAMVVWVDTGASKPVPVVLNATSKLHWPASWGRVVPDPQSDTPAVQLPSRAPDALTTPMLAGAGSIRIVAKVKTVVLPSKRRQGFALDLRFSGK